MNTAVTFVQVNWLQILIAVLVACGVLGPVARKMGYPRLAQGLEAVGFALASLIGAFRPGTPLPGAPKDGTAMPSGGPDVEAGK